MASAASRAANCHARPDEQWRAASAVLQGLDMRERRAVLDRLAVASRYSYWSTFAEVHSASLRPILTM